MFWEYHSLNFLVSPLGLGKMLKRINKAIVSKKNKDVVTMANAMFVEKSSKLEAPFVARNKDVFQCKVWNVSFESPASACDSINAWAKNETRGEWSQLLGPRFVRFYTFANERVN